MSWEFPGFRVYWKLKAQRSEQGFRSSWRCEDSLNSLRAFTFDLGLGGEELLTPRLTGALGAFISDVSHGKAVVARFALITGKCAALRTWIKRACLSVAVLLVKLVLAHNAHGFPPDAGGDRTTASPEILPEFVQSLEPGNSCNFLTWT
jgi:hypothetical protein